MTEEGELRRRREAKGLAQEDLAKILGISRQSLHALESGKCFPSLPVLARLERFFEVSWRELFPELGAQYPLGEPTKQTNKGGPMTNKNFFNEFFDFHFPDDVFSFWRSDLFSRLSKVLKVDLADKGDAFELKADLPGFGKDEVEVEVRPREILIKAQRKEEEKREAKNYFYQETSASSLARRLSLPEEIDPEKAKAFLKNGRLTVVLPKVAREGGRKIKPE